MRVWVAIVSALMMAGTAFAQVRPDNYGFLEQWQVLSEEVRLGQTKLDDRGLPPGYDTEVNKATAEGHFLVSVKAKDEPAPFNKIHTWVITITTPDGKVVSGAELDFYGGMPLHNHSFPTEPRITGEAEPGTYTLEGVKFSMSGWWAMALGIEADGKSDKVDFNLLVRP